METKHFNKMLSSKGKDKEVCNLTAKTSNQEETIANIKVSNNKFKNDIKKLNRSLKQKQIEANPVYSCYICGKPLKKVEDMKEHVDEDHSDILSNLNTSHLENVQIWNLETTCCQTQLKT